MSAGIRMGMSDGKSGGESGAEMGREAALAAVLISKRPQRSRLRICTVSQRRQSALRVPHEAA
jgi:hypothetical protein